MHFLRLFLAFIWLDNFSKINKRGDDYSVLESKNSVPFKHISSIAQGNIPQIYLIVKPSSFMQDIRFVMKFSYPVKKYLLFWIASNRIERHSSFF